VLHSLVKKIVQNKDGNITPFYYTYTDGGVFGFYANGAAEHATAILLVKYASNSLLSLH
jgi:hypothetical protein